MKWVKTHNDLDAEDVDKSDVDQISVFKVYLDQTILNADLQNKKKFVKWIIYPFDKKTPAQQDEYSDEEKAAIKLYGDAVHNPLPDFKNRKALRRFEVFCGGFLYYHDVVFKKYPQGKGYSDEKGNPEWKTYPDNDFEHNIYFEWLPVGPISKKTKVKIYINPTPPEFNPNPPPPPPPPPPESNK